MSQSTMRRMLCILGGGAIMVGVVLHSLTAGEVTATSPTDRSLVAQQAQAPGPGSPQQREPGMQPGGAGGGTEPGMRPGGGEPGMRPGGGEPGMRPGAGEPGMAPSTAPPTDTGQPALGGTTPSMAAGPTLSGGETRVSAGTEPSGAISVSGGQSQPRAGGDVGDLLGKSQESSGIELQRRSPVISDPRIRGEHVGQVVTFSDGGYFQPGRQDLDTAVSKYDSSILRDVIVFKGPYSVLYGPGFSFLDIATLDTPRYQHGPEYHGQTSLGYQSNGSRANLLQSLWGGSEAWGFRFGYGLRAGRSYDAGNGYKVPAHYLSEPANFDVGFDLSPDSKIEFKGLHLEQYNVEFPGLYFDINHLRTDAESIHYVVNHQEFFDRFVLDAWYNRTTAYGDTHREPKQTFLNTLLSSSFTTSPAFTMFPFTTTPFIPVSDRSSTNFSENSQGYRMSLTWGEAAKAGEAPKAYLTVGTDLNYINQDLIENLQLYQPLGLPVQEFQGSSVGFQQLGIPTAHLVDPGIFAEALLPLGKRAKIKAGVRGDFLDINSGPRLISGNIPIFFTPPANAITAFDPIIFSSQPGNDDLHRNFALWSAYASGDYKVDEHLTVLASFGYAERPPTLTELYASGPFVAVLQQGLDRLYGDPHLQPEQVQQMDVGLRADYGWFRGGATGFYAWIHNYITFDLNTANSSPVATANRGLTPLPTGQMNATQNPIAQVVFTNTEEATLSGGEVYSEVDFLSWLTGFGNVTYVEGRDLTHLDNVRQLNLASSRRTVQNGVPNTAAQEPLPAIPPLEGRVGLRVHEPRTNPKWSVELAIRMVREQDLVAASLQEQPTPGFTVWDLRGYWQVSKALLVTGGVENIGNKFYREHLDPLAGDPTDRLFRPGTNYYFGAQLQY